MADGNISFSVGEDGEPYATYKVGADSVTKKLGSGFINLGTGTSFNVSSINGYQKLTADDFIVEPINVGVTRYAVNTSNDNQTYVYRGLTVTKSYNAINGILTAYATIHCSTTYPNSDGSINTNVKAYLAK